MTDTPAPAEALSKPTRTRLEPLNPYGTPQECSICGQRKALDVEHVCGGCRDAEHLADWQEYALAALARAEEAEAREAEALAAIDAAIQCETDLLDMYQRRTSLTTLDLAVADLKRDSLPKLKAARAALAGSPS